MVQYCSSMNKQLVECIKFSTLKICQIYIILCLSYTKTAETLKNYSYYEQTGESRESWCSVERMKEETFCRAQRRHFDVHLQSSEATGQAAKIEKPGRCEWKPEKPKLKERKHFAHRCKYRSPMKIGITISDCLNCSMSYASGCIIRIIASYYINFVVDSQLSI